MLILVGFFVARRYVKVGEDASVAGHDLGVFLGGVGKAANSAGGSTSVGGTAWGYELGIAASWYAIGEGLGYLMYLPVLKQIWRVLYRTKTNTVGGPLGYRWGKPARAFGGGVNALAYTSFVGAQIIATGTVIHVLLDWNYTVSILVSTGVILVYCTAGGLRAIVITDIIQMALIIGCLGFVMPPIIFGEAGSMLGSTGGPIEGIKTVWEHFSSNEATATLTNWGAPGSLGWGYVIGAIIVPCLFLCPTMQADYQYLISIETQQKAFKSYMMVPILYIPVAILVVLIGMCALVIYGPSYLPVESGGEGLNPNMILPTMIQDYLPHGLVGLLLAAILSATMSTSSTCLICATTALTDDVIRPLMKKKLDGKQQLKLFRICMIILGIFTIAITLYVKDIIELLMIGYAAAVGGLLIPVLATMLIKRVTKPAVYSSMICGTASYIVLWIAANFGGASIGPDGLFTEAPIFVSLPLSAVVLIVVSLLTQKCSYGNYDAFTTAGWEASPNNWEKHPEVLERFQ
jgi:SSS family solute:Na+ symporter